MEDSHSILPLDFHYVGDFADSPSLCEGAKTPWEVVGRISDYIEAVCDNQRKFTEAAKLSTISDDNKIHIGEGTVIEPGVYIKGPAIIGRNCVLRQNAYIRENVIIGDNCVVGHSCEIKHSVLGNRVQLGHFNYVGDSLIGDDVHFGGGAKCANLKWSGTTVKTECRMDTGMMKFGALVERGVNLGANVLLMPGSLIGAHSVIYSAVTWRGTLGRESIVKSETRAGLRIEKRRPHASIGA